MPRSDWRMRVQDILDALERISAYTRDMDADRFRADDRTVEAVCFAFIVIGEAAGHVPEEVRQRALAVPWTKMRGMRNIAAHEYFGIDRQLLWETARHDVAALVGPLRELLGD